jgi:hypothetical protein
LLRGGNRAADDHPRLPGATPERGSGHGRIQTAPRHVQHPEPTEQQHPTEYRAHELHQARQHRRSALERDVLGDRFRPADLVQVFVHPHEVLRHGLRDELAL